MTRQISRVGLVVIFIGLLLLTVGTYFPVWERFQDRDVTVQPDNYIAVATETRGGVYKYSFSSSGPVEFWAINRENYDLAESKKDFTYLDHKVDAAKGDGEVQMPPNDVLYLVLENHGSVNVDAMLTLRWASQYTAVMTRFLRIIGVVNIIVGIAFAVFRRKNHE